MNPYVIIADSACDISPELLKDWGVVLCHLTFTFNDSSAELTGCDVSIGDFYRRMREGAVARTSAINLGTLKDIFERELKAGNDILYIGFSSGLSTTYHTSEIAAAELRDAYPDRKIVTVDSLAASAGYGLLLHLAVLCKQKGGTLDEVAEYVRNNRLRVCHWFTVDDLVYLKRGGRVSATTAFVGNLLGIKPVLHVDDDGHLIPASKVRGRKASVKALAAKWEALAVNHGTVNHGAASPVDEVFISHGDCLADAQMLSDILREQYGVTVSLITDIGPIIGAHSGPGTLALFFLSDKKR